MSSLVFFIHYITSASLFFNFTEQMHMLGSRGDLNLFITYITSAVLLRCVAHFFNLYSQTLATKIQATRPNCTGTQLQICDQLIGTRASSLRVCRKVRHRELSQGLQVFCSYAFHSKQYPLFIFIISTRACLYSMK